MQNAAEAAEEAPNLESWRRLGRRQENLLAWLRVGTSEKERQDWDCSVRMTQLRDGCLLKGLWGRGEP